MQLTHQVFLEPIDPRLSHDLVASGANRVDHTAVHRFTSFLGLRGLFKKHFPQNIFFFLLLALVLILTGVFHIVVMRLIEDA